MYTYLIVFSFSSFAIYKIWHHQTRIWDEFRCVRSEATFSGMEAICMLRGFYTQKSKQTHIRNLDHRNEWTTCIPPTTSSVIWYLLIRLAITQSCNDDPIIWLVVNYRFCTFFECEWFLVSFLFYDSELNMFGFWQKQDTWGRFHPLLMLLKAHATNRFIKKIINRWI